MMNSKQFFHLCSDGEDSRNFITGDRDFASAMDIVALCAANTDLSVVSFSIQDTHYHFLLYGKTDECVRFKAIFETTYRHYVSSTRGDTSNAIPEGELYPVGENADYLRNVAAYTVIQPTKDGKHIMPYDYRWGSGSLYFRKDYHVHLWHYNNEGVYLDERHFGSLTVDEKRELAHSRIYKIPEYWSVCGDIILPHNYVDVRCFEGIFRTHNCFRVYFSSNRKKEEEILLRIADEKGVYLEDMEARQLCRNECLSRFGTGNMRLLDPKNRIRLAQHLHRTYHVSYRQLSSILRLPDSEIRRYVP